MAAGSLLALFDDIITVLDDVSAMTKVAAKKTAGVLGDDLALNAEQVTGVRAERELPVVWAVAKGSFINKLILVPAALTLSYFIPKVIPILLMLGGLFLCFEGFEKVMHKLLDDKEEVAAKKQQRMQTLADTNVDLVELEKDKIKGAILTDFILSAEIIVIALGTVTDAAFSNQVIVVSLLAIGITVLVYGLVGGIVKLDDLGLYLMQHEGDGILDQIQRKIGLVILKFAPILMRLLTIVGTAAMFLVGGSIIGHGIPPLHHLGQHIAEAASKVNSFLGAITPILTDAIIGIIAGGICVLVFFIVKKFLPNQQASH